MMRQLRSYIQGSYEFNEEYWNNISDLDKKHYKKYIKILKEEVK